MFLDSATVSKDGASKYTHHSCVEDFYECLELVVTAEFHKDLTHAPNDMFAIDFLASVPLIKQIPMQLVRGSGRSWYTRCWECAVGEVVQ